MFVLFLFNFVFAMACRLCPQCFTFFPHPKFGGLGLMVQPGFLATLKEFIPTLNYINTR
jgi:hypothetical protein